MSFASCPTALLPLFGGLRLPFDRYLAAQAALHLFQYHPEATARELELLRAIGEGDLVANLPPGCRVTAPDLQRAADAAQKRARDRAKGRALAQQQQRNGEGAPAKGEAKKNAKR